MNKFKTQPYRHQLNCLNEFGRKEYFALLAEMGTGKSWIVINNIADLWSSSDLDGVMVFAPNGVHTNWVLREIPKHMPDYVRMKTAAWSSSFTKQEKHDYDELIGCADNSVLRIFTMNWEGLSNKRSFEAAEKFCRSCRRLMIVCDESHNVKNPSAQRTKALEKLKKFSHWRRIMTGTAITNAPFDAFSQFNFLEDGLLGTTSYFAFKAEFAEMMSADSGMMKGIMKKHNLRRAPQIVSRGADGMPRYKNLDKLSAMMAPHSFRVLKKDCLDLPDKIYKTAYFDMTKEQWSIYKKAEEEGRLSLEGEDTPFNRLVIMGKLAQITSGYYLHPDADEPVRIDGADRKLSLLMERVNEIVVEQKKKLIIWARYRVEIEDICRLLRETGINHVQYHGGVKKTERSAAIDSFENGEAEVFVGQQQAGGTGITLVAASFVIYFSNTFSLGDRLQSEDRAHRIGQTENVTYINLIAKGTIDEAIVGALESKKNVSEITLAFSKNIRHN